MGMDVLVGFALGFALRSERMPSKNISSWSRKKTTGSMEGRPPLA